LCFTRALARELERAGYAASTIGDKVAEIVNKCEPNYAQGKDPVNWSAEEWKRALHLAAYSASVPVMGDVAIVDEAHDLTTDHWILIDKLVGGREVWAFGDESQEFFFGNAMHLRFPIRYMLNATYRTPSSLQTLADMYVLETTPTRGDLNDTSEAFELVEGPSASHDEKVAKLVRNLVSHGVPASSIAVLSLKSYEGSSAPKIPGDLGAAQSRADDPIAGKCIVVDSVRRFKGLERPFIILRDLDPELDHYGIRMRIALTRCLVKMWVVAAPDTLEKDRVLLAAKAQLEREARGEGASPSMEPMVSARGTVGRVSRPPWKSVPPPAATEGEAKLAGEEHSQIRTIPKLGSVPPPSGSSGARTPKEGA
jgi:hypothetical protein